MGDRLIDDGTERSYADEASHIEKQRSGLYGSISSRDQPRDHDNFDDSPLNSDIDTKNGGFGGLGHQRKDSGDSTNTFSRPKKKSVFDEYEQRGGVLEGYEDLNAESQDDDDDHVLREIVAD